MQKKEIDTQFLELFEKYRRDLSNFSMALTRDREKAKDLVADTILLAYESFHKLQKPESFKSYLFTIASRVHKRKIWRQRIFGVFSEEYALNLPDKSVNLERNIENELLYSAIAKLPAKQAEALVLFEITGLSLNEVLEVQGGTLSGVKSRLKRAREKLAEILKNDIDYYKSDEVQEYKSEIAEVS